MVSPTRTFYERWCWWAERTAASGEDLRLMLYGAMLWLKAVGLPPGEEMKSLVGTSFVSLLAV